MPKLEGISKHTEVVLKVHIHEYLQEHFLQFMEERFGKISFYHFGSEEMKIKFEAINSTRKCLSSQIIFNKKTIKAKMLHNNQQSNREVAESPKKKMPHYSFEEKLFQLIIQIEQPPDYVIKLDSLLKSLQFVLEKVLPGCAAIPPSSVYTKLALKDGDIDLFVVFDNNCIPNSLESQTPTEFRGYLVILVEYLSKLKNEFSDVVGFLIDEILLLKFTHLATNLNCRLSINNFMYIHKSLLLRSILNTDKRLRPMFMFLKYWAKTHEIINEFSFTDDSIIMLAIYYLQTIKSPMLPTIENLQMGSECEVFEIDGWNCGFDLSMINSFTNENRDSIIMLLQGFFQMCSEFEFEKYVISIFTGAKYSKQFFRKVEDFPSAFNHYANRINTGADKIPSMNSICILDPFVHSHNLTENVNQRDVESFKNHCKLSVNDINELAEEHVINKLLGIEVSLPQKQAKVIRIDLSSNFKLETQYNINIKSHIKNIILCYLGCDSKIINQVCNYEQNGEPPIYTFTYNCVLFYKTWEDRERYVNYEIEDILSREKLITDAIIRNDYGDIQPEKPLFEFNIKCKLTMAWVEFTIECVEPNSAFYTFYDHFNHKLQYLLIHLMNLDFNKEEINLLDCFQILFCVFLVYYFIPSIKIFN